MRCCWELFEKCFCLLERFLPASCEMIMSGEVRMGWYFAAVSYALLLKAEMWDLSVLFRK